VRESENAGAGVGPLDEQLARISTAEVEVAGRKALVVVVAGEIDLHTVDRFRSAVGQGLERVADDGANGGADDEDDDAASGIMLVVDLTDVTFLGSHGLAALVEATRAAHRRREPLPVVVDHTRPVIRPIELSGLDDILALYHTVDDAVLGREI